MSQFFQIPRMLISDDDRDLRESLGQLFASRGFETVLACDGREALDIVCQQQVHLVIIDFNMPRMTGLEALRKIKQYDRQLPVILMSAELNDELSQQIIEAQAYSLHSKPIDIMQIRQDVSRALRSIYNWSIEC